MKLNPEWWFVYLMGGIFAAALLFELMAFSRARVRGWRRRWRRVQAFKRRGLRVPKRWLTGVN